MAMVTEPTSIRRFLRGIGEPSSSTRRARSQPWGGVSAASAFTHLATGVFVGPIVDRSPRLPSES